MDRVGRLGWFFRKFPDFKGKQRLARLLLGKSIRYYNQFTVDGKFDCKYAVPNLTDIIGLELFLNGIFEEGVIRFIVRHIPEKGCILDIGANIGAVTVPVCKLRPLVQVVSVEASPFVIPYLKRNATLNNIQNCVILEGAVSDRSGVELDFYYPTEQFGKGAVTNLYHAEKIRVPAYSLDEIIRVNQISHVDLIKMDIEGYEYFAFKGAAKLLNGAQAPDILFEFVDYAESAVPGLKPGDAQELLMKSGYHLFVLHGDSLLPLAIPVRSGFSMIFATKRRLPS